MPKLSTDQVNYLNIALMLLSAGLAFAFPFELFLLVYAILGPLHYLTEISWLHDKRYFAKSKYDPLFLVAAGVGITAIALDFVAGAPHAAVAALTYFAFVAALLFALSPNTSIRLGGLMFAAIACVFFIASPLFAVIFGLLLPTLIHVFVFTGLFILVGALKSKSFSGLLSFFVFVAVACGFFFIHPAHPQYQVSDYVRSSYGLAGGDGNPFMSLNLYLARALGLAHFGSGHFVEVNDFLYRNPAALALMSFIAFAYCYHYLNWFSKTSVIRWHEISPARTAAIGSLWIASLVLYGVSYALGFKWLFFLSFTHVLLEFPLDQLTVINATKMLRRGRLP